MNEPTGDGMYYGINSPADAETNIVAYLGFLGDLDENALAAEIWCQADESGHVTDAALARGMLAAGADPSDWLDIFGAVTICKHADPVEGALEDITPSEASEIMAIDRSLVWIR